MPQTDNYGQAIQSPTLTDPPNIQTAFQGVVDGLTQRSVMRFPSATVRGATLTTPQAGMVTYLKDTQLLEYFDGETWQTVVASNLPWADVDLASGYAPWGGSTVQPRVRREGSIVYLEGRLKPVGGGNLPKMQSVSVGTIPAAYQPAGHYAEGFVSLTGTIGGGTPLGRIEVWPSNSLNASDKGDIKVWTDRTSAFIGFSSWWFVN